MLWIEVVLLRQEVTSRVKISIVKMRLGYRLSVGRVSEVWCLGRVLACAGVSDVFRGVCVCMADLEISLSLL